MAKILMIEDNKDILDANAIMLELEGYEVLPAKDIANGRRLALKEAPDLIILDVLLPDGNGIDLCRELMRERDFCIIFLSALGTKNDVLEGLRAGACKAVHYGGTSAPRQGDVKELRTCAKRRFPLWNDFL